VIAFTSDDINLTQLSIAMRKRGWILQVQPGSIHMGFPQSIHLTISPIHEKLVEEFLRDLSESVEEVKRSRVAVSIEKVSSLVKDITVLLETLNLGKGVSLSDETVILINEAIRLLEPSLVDDLVLKVVNEVVF
ncbi:MAG: hypothetical protein ACP5N5_06905, partial [Desulfurococcus sp.]